LTLDTKRASLDPSPLILRDRSLDERPITTRTESGIGSLT
jgi:hypothetical protein